MALKIFGFLPVAPWQKAYLVYLAEGVKAAEVIAASVSSRRWVSRTEYDCVKNQINALTASVAGR